MDRHHGFWTHRSSFSFNPDPTPPQKVDAPMVRNPEQPGRQWTAVVVLVQLPVSLE